MANGFYDLVDRDVAFLNPAGRVLVVALRLWVAVRQRAACPAPEVGRLFARHGLIAALLPFHRFMLVLSVGATRHLSFGCPCTTRMGEDEALILALIGQARDRTGLSLVESISHLVGEEALTPMLAALTDLALVLDQRSALPGMLAD